jgi:hypothetical protein
MLLRRPTAKDPLEDFADRALPVFIASVVDERPAKGSLVFSVRDVVAVCEIDVHTVTVFPGVVLLDDCEGKERYRLEGLGGGHTPGHTEIVPGFGVALKGVAKMALCVEAGYAGVVSPNAVDRPDYYETWRERLVNRRNELVGYWSRLLARTVTR